MRKMATDKERRRGSRGTESFHERRACREGPGEDVLAEDVLADDVSEKTVFSRLRGIVC
ncbi:hypothetical protein PICMEDRAFT_131474 [Pichia membranifaciens NRRL Y-2026]|uniref:Uncharacterized protein n=1 Tax=Pichia membranifaciens NRRL Y-2026 TaxID=763406 RepID=A0A1E3NK51_9ASCO|nr:hypothetical protein PICMEDRAFT_131474 [Pichia membranifaciens NRRL Y-2026]ODQ46522.1 hypothetical protein PICMEDRAFT_131474 [Pichia membranifaciens NRRL Y-2026]